MSPRSTVIKAGLTGCVRDQSMIRSRAGSSFQRVFPAVVGSVGWLV